MTTFLLIRHGLTDAIGHYLPGTASGTPLNDEGRAQAERLAARLHDVPLTRVVSSPLIRARETAAPVAASHRLQIQIVPALTEFEVGAWTGRSFADLEQDPEWRRFNDVRSGVRPPGGESMLDVQQRAVTAIFNLAQETPTGTIAVFSHGDVIRAALMYILGTPLDLVHRLDVSPARISVVTVDGPSATVKLVNSDTVPEAV